MESLTELNVLIDRASAIAGSDYRLAKLIGMSPQNVSNWRHGAASCSPENRALLASVAGLDAMAELARATVEKHQGTKKGDMLMRALGKGLLATGAAVTSAGASAASIFSTIPAPAHLGEWVSALATLCVERLKRRSQFGLCQPLAA